MAVANDMSALLRKISENLGMDPVLDSLPEEFNIDKWAHIIKTHSLVTFSRYFPHKFNMVINDTTVNKRKEAGVYWYYIKDEVLAGAKLLGVKDIDWMDLSTNNTALGARSLGGGYYYPDFGCPEATMEAVLGLQFAANMNSLYNRGIYIEFRDPNRFALKGIANTNYNLNSFVVVLLVEHSSLITISPTKMEVFEKLAQSDVAKFLYNNLRYWDNLPTIFGNIDFKLSELQEEANKREDAIQELKESYVSASNENQPLIWTV